MIMIVKKIKVLLNFYKIQKNDQDFIIIGLLFFTKIIRLRYTKN